MFHQNRLIRRYFLLINIIFITPLFSYYKPIYDNSLPKFKYTIENNKYKLFLKDPQYIKYKLEGFKLFLPKFTTDYELNLLRVNSIGKISGNLSINKNTPNNNSIYSNNLKYYLTDYRKKNKRQLDYLLKGKSIHYKDETSLVISGYNLPKKINTKLGKWVYFKFDKNKRNNKLSYLEYSFSINLDKKRVDAYVKKHLKIKKNNNKFHLLNSFLNNIYK